MLASELKEIIDSLDDPSKYLVEYTSTSIFDSPPAWVEDFALVHNNDVHLLILSGAQVRRN